MAHNCHKCGKDFKKKQHLEYHLNKKTPCDGEVHQENENNQIDAKKLREYLEDCKCVYCGKEFTRKNSVLYHIKNNCKKVREIENEKQKIFIKLKEEENLRITELANENSKLKDIIQQQEKNFEKKFLELQKNILEIKSQNLTTNTNNSHNNTNSNNNNVNIDNSIKDSNIQQQIILANYTSNGMPPISREELLPIFKRGFQAPVELTKSIHFNPKYPEYHNVYIPRINEKHGMIFVDNKWKFIDRNELIDDIYEHKRAYIVENLDSFIKGINENEKTRLKRWLDQDDNDESIKNTKNDIKRLLVNNKNMAVERKKELEKQNKKKKYELATIKKPKIEEYDSNSNSDSDNISNYSYDKDNDSD
jgi:hypothetical protein